MVFIRETFSEGGTGSFARVASGFTVAASITALLFQTFHLGHAPDAVTVGGLAAFAIAPYSASRAAAAVQAKFNGSVVPDQQPH